MRRDENSGEARGGPLPPLLVFVVLMSVLVAVGAVVLVTRNDPPPPPRPTSTPSPDFSLTDAEAIARLTELNEIALQAFRTRDESLLPLVFAEESPAGRRAGKSLRKLIRDGVRDRTRVRTKSISVSDRSADIISLREERTLYPCFVDGAGQNVTRDTNPVAEVLRRTLKLQQSVWLIHESVVIRSRSLGGHRACP